MSDKVIFTVGRRKNAVARVKLIPGGSGAITINDKKTQDYLKVDRFVKHATEGLALVGAQDKFDFKIRVHGGGISGQAGAIRMGIARALQKQDGGYRAELKKFGHLIRDSRMVERKKYGLHKARKGTQFSKR